METTNDFDDSTVLFIRRLHDIWRSKAPESSYAELRDALLVQRERVDIQIVSLGAVASVAYRNVQEHQHSKWDEFFDLARDTNGEFEERSSGSEHGLAAQGKVGSKRSLGERARLRNLAIVSALWSHEVICHYGWNTAAQIQLQKLRACALLYPRFEEDFCPRLNVVLLDRHRDALRQGRGKTLFEASFQPHRDLNLDALASAHMDTGGEEDWIKSKDGVVSVDDKGTLLKDLRPRHFELYLLQKDCYGMLVPRKEVDRPSASQRAFSNDVNFPAGDDTYGPNAPASQSSREPTSWSPRETLQVRSFTANPSLSLVHMANDTMLDTNLAQLLAEETLHNPISIAPEGAPSTEGTISTLFPSPSAPLSDSQSLQDNFQTSSSGSGPRRAASNMSCDSPSLVISSFPAEASETSQLLSRAQINLDGEPNSALNLLSPSSDVMNTCDQLWNDSLLDWDGDSSSIPNWTLLLDDPNLMDVTWEYICPALSPGSDPGLTQAAMDIMPKPSLTVCTPSIPITDDLSLEEVLHNRYRDTVLAYIENISCRTETDAKTYRAHEIRASWLSKNTRWARLWTAENSGMIPGSASSSHQAEVLHYSSFEFVKAARDGTIFSKPTVIKENFTDGGMHTQSELTTLLKDSLGNTTVELKSLEGSQPEAITISDFINALISDTGSANAINALNLPNLNLANAPLFTKLLRFRLLRNLMIREEGVNGKRTVSTPVDVAGWTSFNKAGLKGSFSGPHVDALAGTWVRNLRGMTFWMIVPAEEMMSEWNEFAKARDSWMPRGRQRLLILEQDDVLLLPPGMLVVHAVHSPTPCIMEGGLLWDDLSILQTLHTIYWTSKNLATTNDSIALQLPGVISQLEDVVHSQIERFRGDLPAEDFLLAFREAVKSLKDLGCHCSLCDAECICMIEGRRCTFWCFEHLCQHDFVCMTDAN